MYIIEASVRSDANDLAMRFVTGDFFEAIALCRECRFTKEAIFVYSTSESAGEDGYAFGRVVEAFGGDKDDPIFFRLAGGQSVIFQPEGQAAAVRITNRIYPMQIE